MTRCPQRLIFVTQRGGGGHQGESEIWTCSLTPTRPDRRTRSGGCSSGPNCISLSIPAHPRGFSGLRKREAAGAPLSLLARAWGEETAPSAEDRRSHFANVPGPLSLGSVVQAQKVGGGRGRSETGPGSGGKKRDSSWIPGL